jgi:hypothetical protein
MRRTPSFLALPLRPAAASREATATELPEIVLDRDDIGPHRSGV